MALEMAKVMVQAWVPALVLEKVIMLALATEMEMESAQTWATELG